MNRLGALAVAACWLAAEPARPVEQVVPLFMSAGNPVQQGFVRVINHSDSSGTVRIRAVDDTGYEPPAVSLAIGAREVVHFNSNDLEYGNSEKGLSGATGRGTGDWRLLLDTILDIEPLAYVRTVDGFLTSIHDLALVAGRTHYIPTFNPGSNLDQQSALRLINPERQPVDVTIKGFDDGNAASGAVSLTLPGRNAVRLTAADLELGPRALRAAGALGDGRGKWRLFIDAEQPIHAMSLLEDPNGYLTNLSGSRKTAAGLSPVLEGLGLGEYAGSDRSIIGYLTGPVEEGASPGLIAAIVDADGIRAVAAEGARRAGSPQAFLATDHVHIGSNTKAMTSTMLATLVADGTFDEGWDTTVGDTFPELDGEIDGQHMDVTLWELVSMAGGLKRNATKWWGYQDRPIMERRYAILREDLAGPPAVSRGTYHYSNLGYMVAGAMAEKVTGRSWEVLMRERLFGPLGMSTAGFGAPGRAGEVEQPWGHRRDADGGTWMPNQQDNPAALGPAGTVHLAIADWARFMALWLREKPPLILDREALDRLITPPSTGSYAAGWGVVHRSWGRGTVISHDGSNASWYTTLWIAPDLGRAYVVAANSAELNLDVTRSLVQSIVDHLIDHVPGTEGRVAARAGLVVDADDRHWIGTAER